MTLQTSQTCLHHDNLWGHSEDAISFTPLSMEKNWTLSCTEDTIIYRFFHHNQWENKVNPGYPWPHATSTTRQHGRAGTQGVGSKMGCTQGEEGQGRCPSATWIKSYIQGLFYIWFNEHNFDKNCVQIMSRWRIDLSIDLQHLNIYNYSCPSPRTQNVETKHFCKRAIFQFQKTQPISDTFLTRTHQGVVEQSIRHQLLLVILLQRIQAPPPMTSGFQGLLKGTAADGIDFNIRDLKDLQEVLRNGDLQWFTTKILELIWIYSNMSSLKQIMKFWWMMDLS